MTQVMSFDRYLAVTKAFASSKLIRGMRTMTAALVISAIGWVISIIISTPLFMYSNVDRCQICLYTFPATVSVSDLILKKLTGEVNSVFVVVNGSDVPET